MDTLLEYQHLLLEQTNDQFHRFLYHQLPWNERMLAIKGLRGAGKTTMLLQQLKFGDIRNRKNLYLSADHPWLYNNTLLDTAKTWVQHGGEGLYIDEVHKYPNWSRELKNIYDSFPQLRVTFTASSALDLYRGESDLSRRVLSFTLPGMSFREYLELMYQMKLPSISFTDLLESPEAITMELKESIGTPILYFKEYLQKGYLPFTRDDEGKNYLTKLLQVIEASIMNDLAFIEQYSATHAIKIKKLLGVIAESAPFEPNITSLAQKLKLGRDTVNNFLHHLEKALLLNLVHRSSEGMAALQKPDKIYLENTNLSYALKEHPETGTIRETFFLNQLRNAGQEVRLADKGDFIVNDRFIFEVGGKTKSIKQIAGLPDSFVVADGKEIGFGNKIPLWAFGLLY